MRNTRNKERKPHKFLIYYSFFVCLSRRLLVICVVFFLRRNTKQTHTTLFGCLSIEPSYRVTDTNVSEIVQRRATFNSTNKMWLINSNLCIRCERLGLHVGLRREMCECCVIAPACCWSCAHILSCACLSHSPISMANAIRANVFAQLAGKVLIWQCQYFRCSTANVKMIFSLDLSQRERKREKERATVCLATVHNSQIGA